MEESKWIPVRERLPEDEEWVQVQTQDGTVYPAHYKGNKWVPIFRGGIVDHLMHGKVAYWYPHEVGYPYVQCQCGNFYLQAEGRKTCPVCVSMGILSDDEPEEEPKEKQKRQRKAKEKEPELVPEEVPFSEPISMEDDLAMLLAEDEP